MTDRNASEVASDVRALARAAAEQLGVSLDEPMQLSFLGLSVIPELRITDRGLVDVGAFSLTGVNPD